MTGTSRAISSRSAPTASCRYSSSRSRASLSTAGISLALQVSSSQRVDSLYVGWGGGMKVDSLCTHGGEESSGKNQMC